MRLLLIHLISLTILLISGSISGQRLPASINKDPIDWSQWELAMSEEEKLAIIETLKNTVEIEFGLIYYSYTVENILDSYHIVDFNKDGEYDIIYNGFAGKSNNGVMFFERKEDKFRRFLQFYGDIIEVWQSDTWAPLSFKIWNYRCCGNYVSFIETYVPRLTYDLSVKYELSNKIAFVDGTRIPDSFEDYLPFKTVTDSALLCAFPKEDTASYHFQYTQRPFVDIVPHSRYFNFEGNVVAHFEQEARGMIVAEKEVEEHKWYFVMMSYEKLKGGVFCGKGDNNGDSYYMIGWLDAEAIELIPMKKQEKEKEKEEEEEQPTIEISN